MAVDLQSVIVKPSPTFFCARRGDTNMFAAFNCDLSKGGQVKFPVWFREPLAQDPNWSVPDCVYWCEVEMSRDTAVYLAKESLYALLGKLFGTDKIAALVPADVVSGAWDCTTATLAITAYQAAIGTGVGSEVMQVPLDSILFAYLMTNSERVAQIAEYAKTQAGAENWPAVSGAVVPVAMNQYGTFVGAQPPADCPAQPWAPGTPTTPGPGPQPTVPGAAPPGTGYEPTGATEGAEAKRPWLMPVLVGGGLLLGLGAVIYFASRSRQAAPAMGGGEGYGYEGLGEGGVAGFLPPGASECGCEVADEW